MVTSIKKTIRSKPKILIVDDRKTERAILCRLLSKFRVDLHTAESGQAALSLLLRHSFVLVLLDIQMPVMDGIETARLMRSNTPTENIPIIFLTAYDKEEIDMLHGYKVGAIDYLFKPINEEILSYKVGTFLKSYSFEKEKEYEKILTQLERQNKKLKKAREEAVSRMEDANQAKAEALQAQDKLEEQTLELMRYTRELEQFAYVATHDLRAPIINLNGMLKVFKKRGYETKANRDIVEKIEASIGRINGTLNDLIQVVAYRKTLKDEAREVVLEEVYSDVTKDLAEQICESHAQISADFKKAPKLNYIPGHLRSIMQNLLTNAIKYQSDERNPIISIHSSRRKGYLYLKVTDNGMGIAEGKKDKVFGLFQRLDTKASGTGMGLYITKSQVESMGGSIDFSSTPDKGTEFTVVLKEVKKIT